MKILFVILFFAFVFCEKSEESGQSDECKGCEDNKKCNTKDRYQLYGTKTPYDVTRGDIREAEDCEDCMPVSLWSYHRHGNRHPGRSSLKKMKNIVKLKEKILSSFEEGNSKLCAQDIELFKQFNWNTTMEKSPSILTKVGYDELYNIGKRIKEKFPNLLNGDDDAKFYFRSTRKQRTTASGEAFLVGLTEGTKLNLTLDKPIRKDQVLKPYRRCKLYNDKVEDNPQTEAELDVLHKSDIFIALLDDVQKRLGISEKLNSKDIKALYDLCRFYSSWSETNESAWCSVFDDTHLRIMEYHDDLKHYYYNGYGSWINEKLGGPAVKDLVKHFQAINSGEGRNIVSYFTHDASLEMFFSALGLFKDETPLLGNSINDDRHWRTSKMAGFATNFIAVIYKCEVSEMSNVKYRVNFFINEKAVTLCSTKFCTFEEFSEQFKNFEHANLDFCDQLDYNKSFSEE